MTIQDLLRAAQHIDPDVTYEVSDSTIYATGKSPERQTRVYKAFSAKRGEGSHEDIEIHMRGDHVDSITPGGTTLHWQADPLMRAWREQSMIAMEAPAPR